LFRLAVNRRSCRLPKPSHSTAWSSEPL